MTSAAAAQTEWFAAHVQSKRVPRDLAGDSPLIDGPFSGMHKGLDIAVPAPSAYKGGQRALIANMRIGVSDLQRALYSAANSLTLISQAELRQPYDRKEGGGYRTKEIQLYDPTWPSEELLDLPLDTEVTMRVTSPISLSRDPVKSDRWTVTDTFRMP